MATNDTYIPAEYNTGIVRGDYFQESFSLSLNSNPIDLSSSDARIQIRNNSNVLQAEYEMITPPTITGLTVSGTNILVWTIDDTDTALLVPGTYKYDIEITINGKTRTYIRGSFTVERDITV